MNDDEPLHDWASLDEDGLRTYAAQYVGWATNEMSPPENLAWTLEHLPLDIMLSLPTDWEAYHRDEVERNPRYDRDFSDARYHTPVVLSLEGDPIIWDGWHRISCAIVRGDRSILAVVGRKKYWLFGFER